MSNKTLFYFNQLLNAAKIEISENQIEQKQPKNQLYFKLEEDHQDQSEISKMRLSNSDINFADSTGTSRRSSPSDSIFSTCASTNSSSPNSPLSSQSLQSGKIINNSINIISSCQFNYNDNLPNIQKIATDKFLTLKDYYEKNSVLTKRHQQDADIQQTNCYIASTSNVPQFVTTLANSNNSFQKNQLLLSNSNTHRNLPSSSKILPLNIRQSRAAHNELEKNRRANLRGYLDKLKTVLPSDLDSTRDTTLSLLTRARNYLRAIKHQKNVLLKQRQLEMTKLLHLTQELELLKCKNTVASAKNCSDLKKTLLQSKNLVSASILTDQNNCNNFNKNLIYKQIDSERDISYKDLTHNVSLFPTFSTLSSTKSCVSKFQTNTTSSTTFDLYTNGLLPALPLLYPYKELILRHATLSSY